MTTQPTPVGIQLTPQSWVVHHPAWLPYADEALAALPGELSWTQEQLVRFGRLVDQPRLTAVCGVSMTPASRYRVANPEAPWTPTAARILDRLKVELPSWDPNGLIANWYRTGEDSIGRHADNEPALGPAPMVVSVSLGATRNFDLHPVSGGARAARFQLGHGDLLVMGPHVQAEFVHSIAKTRAVTGPRIALTFRHYLEQP